MAEMRFVGGPVDGMASDLGDPVQDRVKLTWPAALGGRGLAIYELFVDSGCAFYHFVGWDGELEGAEREVAGAAV